MRKKIFITLAGTASCVLVAAAGYVLFNKPAVVTNPCKRTFYRLDGKPKVSFKTPQRANWQSLKQLCCYGEVCNPYYANGRYYTGHSNKAPIKSIF